MSARTTIWTSFLSAVVIALVAFFAIRDLRRMPEAAVPQTPESTAVASPASTPQPGSPALALGDKAPNPPGSAAASWPMFHGGQGLLGRAEGDLADSLQLLWKFKTADTVKSSPALDAGRVFVGSSDENVYALDLASGEKLWSYKTAGGIEAAPCVREGRVFVGSADGFLYALDAGTGELKWKYETQGQILGSANWTRAPDGHQTWILVGSYDNKVHCVEAGAGRPVWVYETDNYVNGSPAVADGRCVFGGCDALIHVVSVADGTKVAEIDSGSYIAASAAFLDGQVYVGNYGNVFLRADLAAGKAVWEYARSDAPFFSSPAVGEQFVIFGGRDEQVHCVRRDTGEQVWACKTLGEVNSSPALCGDKIVVGSDDGRLYLLALADGRQLWSYEMGQPVVSSPAVAGGIVVVGCDDGHVYAFGPKAAPGGTAR